MIIKSKYTFSTNRITIKYLMRSYGNNKLLLVWQLFLPVAVDMEPDLYPPYPHVRLHNIIVMEAG